MSWKKLTENDLVIPVIAYLKSNGGFAEIRQFRDYILATYPLSDKDIKMSKRRPGEHMFEQQIRNLTSHHKFEKLGVADAVDGGFRLRETAAKLIETSPEWFFEYLSSGLRADVIRREIESVDSGRRRLSLDERVNEGEKKTVESVMRRSRSSKLRDAAIEKFSKDGVIACCCCGMTFEGVYGEAFGRDCIEIHHKKPLSMYDDADLGLEIREALKNVIPVCPNCHRVIHRNKLFSDNALRKLRKILKR